MKHALASVLLLSLFSACDDNEPENQPRKPDPIIPVTVGYELAEAQIAEDKGSFPIILHFSATAEAEGLIELTIGGDAVYGTHFTTTPAVVGDKIALPVKEGDTEARVNVLVINNAKLNGHKAATFSIANATGSVVKGASVEFSLTVKDDELLNRPQTSTKVASAFAQSKNTYEYNEDGLVAKIHWESKSPFGTTKGTDEYFYNDAGLLERIARVGGTLEQKYIWENGRVAKFEQVVNGSVTYFNLYAYEEGRLARIDNYTKNGGSEFEFRSYTAYSYYGDGNVFQITNYAFDDEEAVFMPSMVTTYKDYVEGHNPAEVTDPAPALPNQKLPAFYSRETTNGIQEYTVAYEFLPDGRLLKRDVSGAPGDTGVTTYTYAD